MGIVDGSPDTGGGGSADIDVDALLTSIESQGPGGIPDTQPVVEAPAEQSAAPQTPAANTTTAQEFEIPVNGQVIKAPADKVKLWASQGYNYSQQMAALKAEREQFEAQQKQYDSQYKPIDDYIRTPEGQKWWATVQQAYSQRDMAALDPANPYTQKLQELGQKLSELDQFKQSIVEREAQAKREQEDQQVVAEIQSLRDSYPELDWNSADPSGQTLEARVLDHAIKNGIKNLRAAFRDYNHDALIKRAEDKGREAIQKDVQKKAKLGLLGTSPNPTQGLSQVQDVKTKSYDDITAEIKREFSIA